MAWNTMVWAAGGSAMNISHAPKAKTVIAIGAKIDALPNRNEMSDSGTKAVAQRRPRRSDPTGTTMKFSQPPGSP